MFGFIPHASLTLLQPGVNEKEKQSLIWFYFVRIYQIINMTGIVVTFTKLAHLVQTALPIDKKIQTVFTSNIKLSDYDRGGV